MSALRAVPEAAHPHDALASAEWAVRGVAELLWVLSDAAEDGGSTEALAVLAGTLKLEADSMKRSLDALKREMENAG